MSDALGQGGFACATCETWIDNIVEVVNHDCEAMFSPDALGQRERSTLLYIEERLVNNGGTLDLAQMNYEDQQNIKLFAAAGLLDVEEQLADPEMEVTKFTDAAWDLAGDCRKHRAQREVEADV